MKPISLLSLAVIFLVSTVTSSALAGDHRKRHSDDYEQFEYYEHNYKQRHKHGHKHKQHRKHAKKHHRKHQRQDYARVIRVKPIYKTVVTHRPDIECRRVPIRQQRRHNSVRHADEVIVGGIIGGVIGHHLGHDNNRPITTLAGTVIGATIAHEASRGHQHENRRHQNGDWVYQERCRKVSHYIKEEQLKGYKVVYKYRGQIYKTKMRNHPGRRIAVDVSVKPKWY